MAWRRFSKLRGEYLGALALRDALLGAEVVLEQPRPHQLVLHEVSGCRAHELGRFLGAAAAWTAIDELDGRGFPAQLPDRTGKGRDPGDAVRRGSGR